MTMPIMLSLIYRYHRFFRFSFGPLLPETFESDVALMKDVLDEYVRDVAAGGGS
eukprot:COSAG05_NODE_8822_length_669_cov_0.631579_1_plen_54_part_00